MEGNLSVMRIPPEWSHKLILRVHYARRLPSIVHAFGLFIDKKEMIGICTFGPPPTASLNSNFVFSNDVKVDVFELNRLCVEENSPKNSSSVLVSGSIKLLPKPCCLVSYADGNQGHVGYIYQATNWVYTGVSDPQDFYLDTSTSKTKRIHPRSVVTRYGSRAPENIPKTLKLYKEEFGKHRYFYFLGSKSQVKQMKSNFKYPVLPYPKGETKRYEVTKQRKSGLLFKI